MCMNMEVIKTTEMNIQGTETTSMNGEAITLT